jgi:hypothetical protein
MRRPPPLVLERVVSVSVLVGLAALCGTSWSWGKAGAMAPLVLTAWWRAQTRLEALLVGAAYQLGATAGLTAAAAGWLEVSMMQAALWVLLVAVGVGGCWAMVVPARCSARFAPVAVLLWVMVTVSPLGAGAWMAGHPWIAAGLWFPGAGWLGLLAMLGVFVVARTPLGALAMVVWALGAVVLGGPARSASNLGVVDTASEPARGEYDFLQQYRVARDALARADLVPAPVVVFPEAAAGMWTTPMRELWAPYSARLEREGRSALVGAVLQRADGRFENVVVGLGRAEGAVVHQRLPVPVAMWRPWDDEGFVARPWASGVLEVDGAQTGLLVCWEGALVWPALRSMSAGATSLVLLANHGWTGPRVETRRGLEAWGALFEVPVGMAENVWRTK